MPIAYITSAGCSVRREGQVLKVTTLESQSTEIQLPLIKGIVLVGRCSMTTEAMIGAMEHNVPVVFVSRGGKIKGLTTPGVQRGAHLRFRQSQLTDNEKLDIARTYVGQKITMQAAFMREMYSRQEDISVGDASAQVQSLLESLSKAQTLDEIRGCEGAAAAAYWGVFNNALRGDISFGGRTRRPPLDEVNCALSLGYTLLVGELSGGIMARGLDLAFGVLHVPQSGRPSLALDLVEPYRIAFVDRLVVRLVNTRQLLKKHFELREDGAVWFNDEGRRIFFTAYEETAQSRGWRKRLAGEIENFVRILGVNDELPEQYPEC